MPGRDAVDQSHRPPTLAPVDPHGDLGLGRRVVGGFAEDEEVGPSCATGSARPLTNRWIWTLAEWPYCFRLPVSMSRTELDFRAQEYANRNGLVIVERLGFGVHGSVFSAESQSQGGRVAIKVHERQPDYQRERDVYLRLKAYEITKIRGCTVPELLGCDDELYVIQMTVVTQPFVLDFAGAYLDQPPDFSEEVLADWRAEKQEQFGGRWPEVTAFSWSVRVHGLRVTSVQIGARCSSTESDRPAIGPEANPEGGVSVLRALTTSGCARRWIGSKGARAQLRGRPIPEKASVILECKEAFENTELSPWNVRLTCRAGRRNKIRQKTATPARSGVAPFLDLFISFDRNAHCRATTSAFSALTTLAVWFLALGDQQEAYAPRSAGRGTRHPHGEVSGHRLAL